MNPSDAKLEAITNVVEGLLTSSTGSGDPREHAFPALVEIARILGLEPMEVLDVLAEQRNNRSCIHGKGPCPICSP